MSTGEYRDSTAQDLYDAARLTHRLDNIHFFQRPMVCRDMTDNRDMDVNTLYACCGDDEACRHVLLRTRPFAGCMDLMHLVAGGEEAWRARPFVSATPTASSCRR
jgi:trimethylamine---corrinoid protein Co-methyltransferase